MGKIPVLFLFALLKKNDRYSTHSLVSLDFLEAWGILVKDVFFVQIIRRCNA